MPVKILIPTPLQNLTGGKDTVEAQADNVTALVETLESQYPGMGNRLRDENGNLRRFVNLYVNDEDVRFLQGADTPLKDGDQVSIVPAIAGGCN